VEFLVQIQVTLPPELPDAFREELMAREQARGWELKNQGVIRRIWRIPGRTANVGIWDASDPTALHDALSSLPMFPYIDATVTPLATHYLEGAGTTPTRAAARESDS
jgi:muconolactone delta-isomerase